MASLLSIQTLENGHLPGPDCFNPVARALAYRADETPRPENWILVEAQRPGVPWQFADAPAELGYTHIGIRLSDDSEHIFIKEALWNIGAGQTDAERLVFLDSDIVFMNRQWALHVSRALDGCDVGSPHGFAYYAEIPDGEENKDYFHLIPSTGFCKSRNSTKTGHPGFGLMMKRRVFDALGGIPCCSSAGGDTWFWYRILGHWKYPCYTFRMPCNAPYVYNFGLHPKPKIGSTMEVCQHIWHGKKDHRQYQAQALLARWATTMPFEDLTPAVDGATLWASIVHDYCYQNTVTTRKQCDIQYRNQLIEDGYPAWKASLTYLGLRMFGRAHWNTPGKDET